MFDFLNDFLLKPFYKLKYLKVKFLYLYQLEECFDVNNKIPKKIYFSVNNKIDVRNPIFHRNFILFYTNVHIPKNYFNDNTINSGEILLFEKSRLEDIEICDWVILEKTSLYDNTVFKFGRVSGFDYYNIHIKQLSHINDYIEYKSIKKYYKYIGKVKENGKIIKEEL